MGAEVRYIASPHFHPLFASDYAYLLYYSTCKHPLAHPYTGPGLSHSLVSLPRPTPKREEGAWPGGPRPTWPRSFFSLWGGAGQTHQRMGKPWPCVGMRQGMFASAII